MHNVARAVSGPDRWEPENMHSRSLASISPSSLAEGGSFALDTGELRLGSHGHLACEQEGAIARASFLGCIS